MKTVVHSSHGRTYHITGANADLWQIATEHGDIFGDKDFDTLARAFSSPDDNERVDASKEMVTKLWSAAPALGPYPFLARLSEFEFERQFHNKYRDHVCHQLKVYLLGLGILSSVPLLREETMALVGEDNLELVWLVTAVFHDVGYVIENEHSQPGTTVWKRVRDDYESTMRNPLRSLIRSCDLSEATERQIQKAYSILTPTLDGMGDLEQDCLFDAFKEEGLKAKLGQLIHGDVRTPVQKYFGYAQKTASSRPPFKDHGVASALLLAKTWLDLDEYLEKLVMQRSPSQVHQNARAAVAALDSIRGAIEGLIARRRKFKVYVMRAAGAMSLHNITPGQWNHADAVAHGLTFDTYRIAIGRGKPDTSNPLAFLLGLVDTLQDWDRPTFSETPNEGALHSHDISVAPDKKSGKVLVYVRSDAEEFIDPTTSKHSRYTKVVRCLKEFLDGDDVDSLIGWNDPNKNLTITGPIAPVPLAHTGPTTADSRWEIDFNSVIKLPTNDPWRWTVVLSKDEASRHGDLMTSLKRNEGQARPRLIDSGFAYWGIGPTIQWRRACQDSFYTVMRKGIDTFQARWQDLLRSFGRSLPCIYVSYGVGTGEKDHVILGTLNTAPIAPVYVPTDMSLDMLVNGAKLASRNVIESSRIIPLQIDFSSAEELATVSDLREIVLEGKPVLFSLLGNTLANFEDDAATLKTLARLIRKNDLMLIELATTKVVDKIATGMASDEYGKIPSFESFVRSALMQHTDLPPNKIAYHGEECHDGEALQIDMSYVSAGKCRGRLIDGSVIELKPKERIRLYRSRKYTHLGIRRILQHAGLTEVASNLQWGDRNSLFGLYLGMCSK